MKDALIHQENYPAIIVKYFGERITLVQASEGIHDIIPIEPAAIPDLIRALLDGMTIDFTEPDKAHFLKNMSKRWDRYNAKPDVFKDYE